MSRYAAVHSLPDGPHQCPERCFHIFLFDASNFDVFCHLHSIPYHFHWVAAYPKYGLHNDLFGDHYSGICHFCTAPRGLCGGYIFRFHLLPVTRAFSGGVPDSGQDNRYIVLSFRPQIFVQNFYIEEKISDGADDDFPYGLHQYTISVPRVPGHS